MEDSTDRIHVDENDYHSLEPENYPLHEHVSHFSFGDLPQSDLRHNIRKKQQGLRHLNLAAVRGIHYVEYAIGKPSQKVRLAVSLNSDYTVFRCSAHVSGHNQFHPLIFMILDISSTHLVSFAGLCKR